MSTNVIMFGAPLLLALAVHYLLPRAKGEVRPGNESIMMGAPFLAIGLWGVVRNLDGGELAMLALATGVAMAGGVCAAFWWRERWYFRRRFIFRFRWGRYDGAVPFGDIDKVAASTGGLVCHMRDGSTWKIPGMADRDQARLAVDALRQATVALPSQAELKAAVGVE